MVGLAEAAPMAGTRPERDPVSQICFYLFGLSVIAGIVQFSNPVPFGPGFEMVAVGRNLAINGSFGNPFLVLDTGPTAVNPPLYPFFLSLLFKLSDTPAFVAIIATIVQIVTNALAASWLPRLTLLAIGSIVPGVFASLLWLASVRLMPAWDASYTAAGLILFCLYTASAVRTERMAGAVGVSGLLAGALLLLNPSSLFVLLPWLGYLVFSRTYQTKRALRFGFIVLAIMCIPTACWMLRNWMVLGSPVLRTNLGMTLYVSNNDCAQPSILESGSAGCYQKNHPNEDRFQAETLRSHGEVAYDKDRVAESLHWIQSNPMRFRYLTVQRLRQFWFPQLVGAVVPVYLIWFGTVLSVPGLLLMAWRREAAAAFLAAVFLLFPLLYYVVVSDVRYRYPILWLSFIAAGNALYSIGQSRVLRLSLGRIKAFARGDRFKLRLSPAANRAS